MKKFLERVIELSGADKGVYAVRIDRTKYMAMYKRTDNRWLCFYIQENKQKIYEDGRMKLSGNTVELYPTKKDFGTTAWTGCETVIKKRYQQMKDIKCPFLNDTV